jgi:hypothetical protein
MYREQEKASGAMGTGSNQHQVRSHDDTAPTLETLGVSKQQSSSWQKLAEPSDKQFEAALTGDPRSVVSSVFNAPDMRARACTTRARSTIRHPAGIRTATDQQR